MVIFRPSTVFIRRLSPSVLSASESSASESKGPPPEGRGVTEGVTEVMPLYELDIVVCSCAQFDFVGPV